MCPQSVVGDYYLLTFVHIYTVIHKEVHRHACAVDASTLIIHGAMFCAFVYSGLCATFSFLCLSSIAAISFMWFSIVVVSTVFAVGLGILVFT